ncbi:hypothetical protein DFO63_4069 [Stenotrophomonas sp. AG209]|uniref:hypothetical protein n=1 Tax=Stenotrophomonas sp. AG209 TaxID=2183909 RepID=UPI000E5BA51B|nr:hypothetical protein [Stenotrophomonas sp. AG209]RIA19693.1 hypothetical protein DFO63_4069 [Stenotrophomonas sp. AG209]
MTTDNKTLADVQSGGRVRLGGAHSLADRITDHLCNNEYDIGGRAELLSCVSEAIAADARERFEAWARLRGHTLTRAADGEYCFINVRNLWTQWQAALSTQPSPGGQGDALELLEAYDQAVEDLSTERSDGWNEDNRRPQLEADVAELRAELVAALAARQPVGEPVAAIGTIEEDEGGFVVHLYPSESLPVGAKVYAAPPGGTE